MIARGVIQSQLAKATDITLAFLVSILLSRLLGPQPYGQYVLILGWVSMAGLFISLGLSQSTSRFVSTIVSDGQSPRHIFINILAIRAGMIGVASLLIVVFKTPLFALLRHPTLANLSVSIVTLFALLQLVNLCWSYFIAQLAVGVTFFANVLRHLTVLGAVSWLATQRDIQLQHVLVLVCIGYGISLWIYFLGEWRNPLRFRPRAQFFGKPFIKFGLSAWGAALVTFLLSEQTDILLLGYLVSDTSQVAFYQVGTSLVWKLIGVITVSSQLVLTSFSMLQQRAGLVGIGQGWGLFIKLSACTIVPIYLFIFLTAPELIHLAYGAAFSASANILRLFLAVMLLPIGFLGGGLNLMVLYALDKANVGLLLRVAAGVANLVLAIFFIQRLGTIGAVIATGAATIFGTLLEFWVAKRYIKPRYPWKFVLKIAGAATFASLPIWWLRYPSWFALVGAGALYGTVFLLLLLWWRPLTVTDQAILTGLNKQISAYTRYFVKEQTSLGFQSDE